MCEFEGAIWTNMLGRGTKPGDSIRLEVTFTTFEFGSQITIPPMSRQELPGTWDVFVVWPCFWVDCLGFCNCIFNPVAFGPPKYHTYKTQRNSGGMAGCQGKYLRMFPLSLGHSFLATGWAASRLLTASNSWRPKNLHKFTPVGGSSLHPGRLTWNLLINHLERKMIWTKPPWGHVPAVNLPGCITFLLLPHHI